jgi:hypothetical protein
VGVAQDQPHEDAADLRHGQADEVLVAGCGSPFAACASPARASMDRVMWAFQARQRQYSGTAGRVENCQIGVFLAYATDRGP